jgi:glycosyltransferase involved in cell wall biosynthesis
VNKSFVRGNYFFVATDTIPFSVKAGEAKPSAPLPWATRLRVGWSLLVLWAREYVTCDSRMLRWTAGVFGYVSTVVLRLLGLVERRFKLLCALHRADISLAANRLAERTVRTVAAGKDCDIARSLQRYVAQVRRTPGAARFFDDPTRLFGPGAIVLKSPHGCEKGLLYVHYNHILPLVPRFFDLERIAERYHIAIEPSWSGFCDLDVLAYCQYRFPVFVSAYEPRDAEFVRSTNSNLVPIPLSTNWWVDHRVFFPIAHAVKDIDVVMIAGWGPYKRHFRFFDALKRLRQQGHRLRVMLIGYPVGSSKEMVVRQSKYYGIRDQLEIHENVPYEGVNELVNRAKISVVWSRKEGVNRAIIEGMFAGVPAIVREGFNYGFHYPYINGQTGCFADEATLPRAMLELIERSPDMNPRAWVMEHMSCQRATQILSDCVGRWCAGNGEPWTQSPVVKVTKLHSMQYLEPDDTDRFKSDYEWLKAMVRS